MKTRIVLILITLLCAAMANVQSARAATIMVTNTNDSGLGSLRNALAAANDGDTIEATGVSGTILLKSGELEVTHGVTINGPGAGNLSVDGNATDRVFYINPTTVTIDGLTIVNGASDIGGGIYNDEAILTVSNCIISGNDGGGIVNFVGTLTMSNCTISNNFGGGISNVPGLHGCCTTLTVTNCTISGNSADYGGGISNNAPLTISNSTISGNSASYGGGIFPTVGL